jgi:hypothetical protein
MKARTMTRVGCWGGSVLACLLLATPLRAQERAGQYGQNASSARQVTEPASMEGNPQAIAQQMERDNITLESAASKVERRYGPALSAQAVLMPEAQLKDIERGTRTESANGMNEDMTGRMPSNRMGKSNRMGNMGHMGMMSHARRTAQGVTGEEGMGGRRMENTNQNDRLVFEVTCINERGRLPNGARTAANRNATSGEVMLVYVDGQTGKLYTSPSGAVATGK